MLVRGLRTHVPPLHHTTLLCHDIMCRNQAWMIEYGARFEKRIETATPFSINFMACTLLTDVCKDRSQWILMR